MAELISLELLKEVLRIDHDDDDTSLALMISASSGLVIGHLKDQASEILTIASDGEVTGSIPDDIAMATAIQVGVWYDGGEDADRSETLCAAAAAILHRRRDPAVA